MELLGRTAEKGIVVFIYRQSNLNFSDFIYVEATKQFFFKGILDADEIRIAIRLTVNSAFIDGTIDAISFPDFEVKRKNGNSFDIYFRLENTRLLNMQRNGNKQEVVYYDTEQGHLKAKLRSKTIPQKKKKKRKKNTSSWYELHPILGGSFSGR